MGLLGHNGAGNHCDEGHDSYLEPTAGSVSVGGIDVVGDRIGVQRQIGYMPEKHHCTEMLVQEYLLMMAQFRGLSSREQVPAVAEAVSQQGSRSDCYNQSARSRRAIGSVWDWHRRFA